MIKMSKRERNMVTVAVIAIAIFMIIQFGVIPLKGKRERMARALDSKTDTLTQMIQLKAQYETLTGNARQARIQFDEREPGFTLFSFLDRLAGQAGIKDHISYMKPSRSEDKESPYRLSLVEMKLQDIDLKQLTPYLHMVETSKNVVYIRRMSITKNRKDEGVVDAILQVETYEL